MLNQKTRSLQLETRAVEESFSRTPQSRKAFLGEVPLLSSRAHLGGRRSGLSRSGKKRTCKGGSGEGTGFWCSPPADSPNPLEEAKLHRRTLGLIYGFTQRDPPPAAMVTLRGGEGIKRWGIEGIRIGTSDRFGRGRGRI